MSVALKRDVNAVQRAYSFLDVKSIVEGEERIIEGIASTPTVDRVGDIVQPMGAKFTVPFPLLWQHRHSEPVGEVFFAKPTKDGIPFKARFKNIPEAGRLKDRLDEAWQSVKYGLVKAVSIGFKIIKHEPIDPAQPYGGWDIKEWDWLELSAVTIPAQTEATITQIRSIVATELTALGESSNERTTKPAGDSASSTKVVKVKETRAMAKKSVAETISAFEATRAAKVARMEEIMEVSSEKGETLDATQTEEYDGLDGEVKSVDEHLVRLRAHEKAIVAKAAPVNGETQDDASKSRAGITRVEVRGNNIPKGIPFTRTIIAKAMEHLTRQSAEEIARARWPDTPEVEQYLKMEKAAVAVGTTTGTTWAEPLVQLTNVPGEFVELLQKGTIIGKIAGFRRVPFMIKVPRQTAGSSVNWIGEAKAKPLSALAFDSLSLTWAKIAGIVPVSEELIRFSNPSAEALIQNDLAASIVALMDRDFIDPTKTLQAGISPASITNGTTPVIATGVTEAAMRTDIKTLFSRFLSNGISVANATWIMTEQQAMAIGLMVTSLGQPSYPGISARGGEFLGLPVVTSENVLGSTGSPGSFAANIILAVPSEILLADDGGVNIDVSREASVQMDTAPDSPVTAATITVSFWQHNMVGIKAERYVNWLKRRAAAAAYISNSAYAE